LSNSRHTWRRPRGWWRVASAVAVVTSFLLVGLAPVGAAEPSCFGAAARDPLQPCRNPRLDRAVIPTPGEAVIVPNAPCNLIEPALNVCGFGVEDTPAQQTVALVGNSHAGHWRAALDVVADALDWRGVSITRSSCPYMQATIHLAEPLRAECSRWTAGIPGWFAAHPEVSTVFVSDQPTPPIVAPGHPILGVQVGAYIAAWNALPPSVQHIVVIRDNPYTHGDVLACVEAAMAEREAAGPRCAVARSVAVKADPEAIAAQRLHSPRVQIIDLTNFFCHARECEPVIGGALVYRDATHLTRSYATTLGPYLLREVRKLMSAWG
jgi:SGNH domain (fused to AT3 domains)